MYIGIGIQFHLIHPWMETWRKTSQFWRNELNDFCEY
jgi:hypothetical protein